MKRLADDLYLLRGFPPDAINVYLMGDVLVDAATRHAGRRILRQVARPRSARTRSRTPTPTTRAPARQICERLGIPLWCGRDDADAMEGGYFEQARAPDQPADRVGVGRARPSGRAAARRGRRGRRLPGPARAGPLARPRRLLARVGPRAGARRRAQQHGRRDRHPRPAASRSASSRPIRRATATPRGGSPQLEPALVCFGHGPPLRDTRAFVEFVAALPALGPSALDRDRPRSSAARAPARVTRHARADASCGGGRRRPESAPPPPRPSRARRRARAAALRQRAAERAASRACGRAELAAGAELVQHARRLRDRGQAAQRGAAVRRETSRRPSDAGGRPQPGRDQHEQAGARRAPQRERRDRLRRSA